MPDRPFIAITCAVDEKSSTSRRAYADAVVRCGGLPVLLPVPAMSVDVDPLADSYVAAFAAFIFSGGDDPDTRVYNQPMHPSAKLVAPERQRFEEALLRALDRRRDTPALGVCLGMQMMSLHAGGILNQHLPDNTPTHEEHTKDHAHEVRIEGPAAAAAPIRLPAQGTKVASWHHQAVSDAGRLAVFARAHDGVIEGVFDPTRPFHVGVQWHPERTNDQAGGDDVIRALVDAARSQAH